LEAIDRHAPEAIVTLGGDCHVDFAPLNYLSERYGDDLAAHEILHAISPPPPLGGIFSASIAFRFHFE
jgi:hypothetical protein